MNSPGHADAREHGDGHHDDHRHGHVREHADDHELSAKAGAPDMSPVEAEDHVTAMLAAFQDEADYFNTENQKWIEKARRLRHRADLDEDLACVNRSNVSRLLRNRNLDEDIGRAICIFLGRYKRSPWLKRQQADNHVIERVGISVLAPWAYGRQMAKCGLKGGHCQQPDFCPTCAFILRQAPAIAEYARLHERCTSLGWHLYAFTASYEINPNKAGLCLVIHKADKRTRTREKAYRFRPYRSQTTLDPLTSDYGPHLADLQACFEAGFKLNAALLRAGFVTGALGHRDLAIGFEPHWVLAHTHSLVITRHPITPPIANEIFDRFNRIYRNHADGGCLYPGSSVIPVLKRVRSLWHRAKVWSCPTRLI